MRPDRVPRCCTRLVLLLHGCQACCGRMLFLPTCLVFALGGNGEQEVRWELGEPGRLCRRLGLPLCGAAFPHGIESWLAEPMAGTDAFRGAHGQPQPQARRGGCTRICATRSELEAAALPGRKAGQADPDREASAPWRSVPISREILCDTLLTSARGEGQCTCACTHTHAHMHALTCACTCLSRGVPAAGGLRLFGVLSLCPACEAHALLQQSQAARAVHVAGAGTRARHRAFSVLVSKHLSLSSLRPPAHSLLLLPGRLPHGPRIPAHGYEGKA